MSEAKFTKGEWKIQDDGHGMIGVILKKGLGILIGRKSKETQANAHLIVAAPEMYNLLERLTSHDNCKKDIIHLLGEADNLLAKARGEHD